MGVATWSRNSADMILKQRQHHGDSGRLIRVYCKIFKLDLVTALCLFVLHCTSRARKDWLQYGVLGLGREWNLLWRASRTQWPNAYIMPLPFRRKANETLVAQVFVPLSHVFFQELRYTNSFISFALKHGLCSRTQGLARHSDIYLTM